MELVFENNVYEPLILLETDYPIIYLITRIGNLKLLLASSLSEFRDALLSSG